ncbi:MAG: hypothetical protein RBS56_01130 [Candidatus Gracilibacteria bacterium]|jgi:hypothetical protein|nr:hypothetical protein [Candidatus Gracilibacteria bacterium]
MINDFLKGYFDEAKVFTPHEFAREAVGKMQETSAILGVNGIGATILCSDDQCSAVKDAISEGVAKEIGPSYGDQVNDYLANNRYQRRPFGGIFMPGSTWRSLSPAVHHLPQKIKDPALILWNFPHIGFNGDENSFGNFIRDGHEKHTTSCGALCAVYKAIMNGQEMPEDQDKDVLELHSYIRNIIETNGISDEENGLGILKTTIFAQREQIGRLVNELKILSAKESVKVLLFSGIEIDTNNEGENADDDLLAVTDTVFIENGEETRL